jgi:hypothetical protein
MGLSSEQKASSQIYFAWEGPPSLTHTPTQNYASGSRRKRTRSKVHNSFFTSLGIPVPLGEEFARAKIWSVLSREKNN